MSSESSKLPEFIFGKLSTSEGRLLRVKASASGLIDLNIEPLDPQPQQPVKISVSIGSEVAIKEIKLHYTTDGSVPANQADSTITLSMESSTIDWNTLQWSYLETWIAIIPGQAKGTHVQYIIEATTTTSEIIYCPYLKTEKIDEANLKEIQRFNPNYEPRVYGFFVDEEKIPTWFREAIIYQIFVDRFASNLGEKWSSDRDLSDFFGGTLQGIISRLDYLVDLGVTCLWLTPIFTSSSHHGYDPASHSEIEFRLGTEADWKDLVEAAHQRNIKIILDYVANHFSDEHPVFKKAQITPDSGEIQWFRFRQWPKEYDCFFDVPSQPEVNSENYQVREYLISNACQWLKTGCDGFRLDYAHGLSPAFWSKFRHDTRQVKPDSVTFGEITAPPNTVRLFTGCMDGCLDFKMLELFRGFFGLQNLTVTQFDSQLRKHLAYFGDKLVLPSFLDNHDMNRFLWLVQGDKRRLKLAALCQFSLPHPPIIYYGTEVGLSQLKAVGRLEESRLPMIWGEKQDQELLEFYQKLIRWRRQNPNLTNSIPQPLVIDEEKRIYIYTCASFTIALNNSPNTNTINLTQVPKNTLVLTTDSGIFLDENNLSLSAYGGVIILTE